jgi:ComF family protein
MKFNFFGDIFFPAACVGCGDSLVKGVICDACLRGIDRFDTLFCGTCAARLPERKKICHKDAPYLLGAAGAYDDEPLRELIHALKFQGMTGAAEPLAAILAEYITRLELDLHDFVVTPIPLSMQRARARGFNQSALIARPFANALGLPFEEHLLARIVHRKPQSDTEDIFERRENIKGCFALVPGTDVTGKKIILVDDVTTSGGTFTEAAWVIRSAGAKKIYAIACAKA